MRPHVILLGVMHIVLGALGILGALAVLLIFGGSAGLVGILATRREPDAAIAAPIIGVIGLGLFLLLLALSVPGLVSGIGLLKLRPWARVVGIIYSGLILLHVPLGTAIGIYGFWVLLSGETERRFAADSSPPSRPVIGPS